jgi:hypothetical protein
MEAKLKIKNESERRKFVSVPIMEGSGIDEEYREFKVKLDPDCWLEDEGTLKFSFPQMKSIYDQIHEQVKPLGFQNCSISFENIEYNYNQKTRILGVWPVFGDRLETSEEMNERLEKERVEREKEQKKADKKRLEDEKKLKELAKKLGKTIS